MGGGGGGGGNSDALPPDVVVRGLLGHVPHEGQGEGGKLDEVAQLVPDTPCGYFNTRQNSTNSEPPT